VAINLGGLFGNNPIAQLLNDMSLQQFESLMTSGVQQQITTLNNQVNSFQAQENAWTTLKGDAAAVLSSLTTLTDSTTYQQLSGTSSNAQVINNVAVDGSAQSGSYSIQVDSLAAAELDQGQPPSAISSPTTALGITGSFSIQLGSAPTSSSTWISVTSGETLDQIAQAIDNANMGVTATVVSPASGEYTLQIQANQTDQTIYYADGGSSDPLYTLGFVNSSGTKLSSVVLQAASPGTLQFGSNTSNIIDFSNNNAITNAIPGVTLSAVGTGTTTITIGPDTSAMVQNVQSFVNDWNQWVKDTENLALSTMPGAGLQSGAANFQVNPNQVLTSPIPVMVMNQVEASLGQWYGNSTLSSNPYQSLADLGITFSSSDNGTLTLNQTTLQAALNSNPAAVQNVFEAISGAVSTILNGFENGTNSTTGEAIAQLQTEVAQAQSNMTMADNQLVALQNQAITEYGQWVNAITSAASENQLLTNLYSPNSSSQSGG